MRITESLKIEHQLLRQMMDAMSRWMTEGVEPDKLRERAVMLEAAINCHAKREERQLYAPLNDHSEIAHDLVIMVERVHLEVRKLFEALADPTSEPKELAPKDHRLHRRAFYRRRDRAVPFGREAVGTKGSRRRQPEASPNQEWEA